jgi:predicted transcriptional regulator YheO
MAFPPSIRSKIISHTPYDHAVKNFAPSESPLKNEATKALLANPDIGVTQIAHRLGVSPATLYRYIPAARTANLSDR